MTTSQTTALVVVAVVAVAAIGAGIAYQASVSDDGYSDNDLQTAQETYDEARDLESRNALTADARASLGARYSTSINAVLRRLAALEASGDMDAALELRADLRELLRVSRDLFPNVTESSSASSAGASSSIMSEAESSSMSEDSESSAPASAGASSSIFYQPSSAVTSA